MISSDPNQGGEVIFEAATGSLDRFTTIFGAAIVTVKGITFRNFYPHEPPPPDDPGGGEFPFEGSVFKLWYSTLNVENVIFENNKGYSGSVIFADYSQVNIRNTIFRNNETLWEGSVIWMSHGRLALESASFQSNRLPEGSTAILSLDATEFTCVDTSPSCALL